MRYHVMLDWQNMYFVDFMYMGALFTKEVVQKSMNDKVSQGVQATRISQSQTNANIQRLQAEARNRIAARSAFKRIR